MHKSVVMLQRLMLCSSFVDSLREQDDKGCVGGSYRVLQYIFPTWKSNFSKRKGKRVPASKPIANRPLHVATHLNYSTSLFTTHSHSGFVAQLLDLVPHLYLPYQRHYLPIAIHPTQLVPTHHQFPNKLVVQELKLPLDLRPPAVMPREY